ncbi:MAG: peptidoglycan-associated lipoprotein Pal [Gemmatimonadota bacterium]
MLRKPYGAVLPILLAVGLAACGGQPPPEPPPPPPPAPTVNQDSIDAAALAAAEAAAQQICADAEAAMAAGSYERARSLLQRAVSEYPGTTCANAAPAMVARMDAIRTLAETVHFEYDRSRITDEAAAVLQRKAEVLRQYPDLQIQVAGHCDERGSLEYNQALGQRRASSTVQYLVSLGVAGEMFSTVSFGEERPLAQGQNEAAWAQNRRAEFAIQNMDAL